MIQKNIIYYLFIFILLSCSKKDLEPVKSSAKNIISFSFGSINSGIIYYASIDSLKREISATVPIGTDISKLTPTITVSSKATISPGSGVVQDFSKSVTTPIIYSVVAEDGTIQLYKVRVSVMKNSAKSINSFVFNNINPSIIATIDSVKKTITAIVPIGTDLTKLTPTISISPGASISPATGVAQDFSKSVTYIITAEDGSSQSYSAQIAIPKATIDNNLTVYIGSYNKLYSLNAKTGKDETLIVKLDLTQCCGQISMPLTYANGIIYEKNDDTDLIAIDTKSNKVIWSFDERSSVSVNTLVPLISNNLIYYPTDNKLLAFDAKIGSEKWTSSLTNPCYSTYSTQRFQGSPTIVDGIIYVGSFWGMHAINVENGKEIWGFQENNCGKVPFFSRPEVKDQVVFGGSTNGSFYALDAKTGKEKWHFKTGGSITSSAKIVNGVVFFGCQDNYFYALDAQTGSLKWRFLADGPIFSSPSVESGSIYFSGKNKLYSLRLSDGAINVNYSVALNSGGLNGAASPVIANGVIYITDKNGILRAINAYTGENIWSSNSSFYYSIPIILGNDGKVFVSGENGL